MLLLINIAHILLSIEATVTMFKGRCEAKCIYIIILCLVPTGGVLFEEFLAYNLPRDDRRAWIKLRKECVRARRAMTKAEFAQFSDGRPAVHFYFHILTTLNRRGRAAARQLFYICLLFKHKGISRTGLDMLCTMGLGLPNRTFDQHEENEVNEVNLEHRCVCIHVMEH